MCIRWKCQTLNFYIKTVYLNLNLYISRSLEKILCVYIFQLLWWVPLNCRFTNFGVAVACMWSVILEQGLGKYLVTCCCSKHIVTCGYDKICVTPIPIQTSDSSQLSFHWLFFTEYNELILAVQWTCTMSTEAICWLP